MSTRARATSMRAIRHGQQRTQLARILQWLYGAGEQGIAVPDLTPGNGFLFQDSAGTTPVTAYEQPVGLILDRSKGLVQTTVYTNDGNTASGWVYSGGAGGSIAASGGKLVFTCATTLTALQDRLARYEITGLTTGQNYLVTASLQNISDGVGPRLGIASSALAGDNTGTYVDTNSASLTPVQFIFTASSSIMYLRLIARAGNSNAQIGVDDIRVATLPGNHIIQATSTKRPTLSARYNLLQQTATLSTQNITTTAGSYTINLSGSGSVTLNGTATGTFSAGVNTFTATAGTLTVTVSGTVTNADIRRTTDTIGQPAYQRVGASNDYDTAGFYPYLAFDGTDDSMATAATVDFSGTDKMTVFAGVTRLTDTAGVICELSANWNNNNGTMLFWGGSNTAGTGSAFNSASRGNAAANTNQFGYSPTTFVPPVTAIVTASHDIPGDLSSVQGNGVVGANGTGDKGTGNFGTYPLCIGARGNTALFFNGRMYPFFIRGAATDAGLIAQVEQYIRARMPVNF